MWNVLFVRYDNIQLTYGYQVSPNINDNNIYNTMLRWAHLIRPQWSKPWTVGANLNIIFNLDTIWIWSVITCLLLYFKDFWQKLNVVKDLTNLMRNTVQLKIPLLETFHKFDLWKNVEKNMNRLNNIGP